MKKKFKFYLNFVWFLVNLFLAITAFTVGHKYITEHGVNAQVLILFWSGVLAFVTSFVCYKKMDKE